MAIKLRTFVFVLALFAILLFAAINWPLFVQTSPISLLFTTVMAPLGVIMLLVVAAVTALYLVFLARVETEALVSGRRAGRELDEARKLALSAEESRLAELREELREGFASLDRKVTEILSRAETPGRPASVVEVDGAQAEPVRNREGAV